MSHGAEAEARNVVQAKAEHLVDEDMVDEAIAASKATATASSHNIEMKPWR